MHAHDFLSSSSLKKMAKPILHVEGDAADLQKNVISLIENAAKSSIEDHGFFTLGVSGGSVAKILCQGLAKKQDVDWNKWKVLFCDERHVAFDDPESTYAYYKKEFFDVVSFPTENVLAMNPKVSVEDAAKDYTQQIRTIYPGPQLPSFDLLVLGMGPDGHTCSLFPGHPAVTAERQEEVVVAIKDSPKPPPSRITLTVPVLTAAKRILVIAAGGSKADAVKGSLEPDHGQTPLPAGLAKPHQGELHWFLDPPAAAKLVAKV